jgi:hypothetical protein
MRKSVSAINAFNQVATLVIMPLCYRRGRMAPATGFSRVPAAHGAHRPRISPREILFEQQLKDRDHRLRRMSKRIRLEGIFHSRQEVSLRPVVASEN